MNSIVANFRIGIQKIEAFVDLNVATFDLAKTNPSRFRSRHATADAAKNVHAKARAIPLGVSLACEGAYLSACAQFEKGVRDLIEEAALQMVGKKGSFALLPQKMQDEHTNGCAKILHTIKMDKHRHLTAHRIVSALHGCLVSNAPPTALIVEAFSSNANNFRPDVVADHVGKLGVSKVWDLLGSELCLQAHFNSTSPTDTIKFSRERLHRIMDKRNHMIHRGSSFAAPSVSETTECTSFFRSLIEALGHVLIDHVARF
jgi:RiboL-PSP-HEPN